MWLFLDVWLIRCFLSPVKLVNGKLSSVEALKDIRVELKNLKEGLLSEILEEINKHLYIRPKPKPKVVAEGTGVIFTCTCRLMYMSTTCCCALRGFRY